LALWMGHDFMAQGTTVLRLLACAFFILSMNVALHYILLGAGDIKFVSLTNIIGGALSLIATIALVPVAGINAAAVGRFIYGAIVSLNFSRVAKVLGVSIDKNTLAEDTLPLVAQRLIHQVAKRSSEH